MAEKQIMFSVTVDTTQAIKNLAQYKQAVTNIDKEIEKLRKQMKEEGADTQALGQEIARLTEEKKAYNKEISNTSREVQNNLVAASEKYTNTLKGMRAALSAAKDELAAMSLGTEEYEAQRQKVADLNDEVKGLEQEYGVFTRGVGDYENAIKNALGAMSPFTASVASLATTSGGTATMLGNVGNAIKNVGKQALALLANPIFLVIAGVAAIIMGIVKAIKSSEEHTARLNAIMAPLKRGLDAVLSIMQKAAGAILSVFEAAGAALGWVMDKLEGMPVIGEYIKEINEENAKAIQLEKDKYNLTKQTRQDEIDNAKSALEVAKLRTEAKDKENFSAAERLAKIQEAARIEEQIAQRNVEREKERLRIMQVEASWAENSAETNDALAKQEAAVYKADLDFYNKKRELLEQEATLRNEIAADAKARREKEYNEELKALNHYQQLLKTKQQYNAIYFYDYTASAEENAQRQWKHEQDWAAQSFVAAQRAEKEKLDLMLHYGKITQAEYEAELNKLRTAENNFQLQQLADLEAHSRELMEALINLAGGKSIEGQLADLEEQYRIAFETLKNDAYLSAEERAFYEEALTQELERKREAIIKDGEEKVKAIRQQAYAEREEALNKELQIAWDNAKEQYEIKRAFLEKELEDEKLTAEERARLEQELAELNAQHQQQKIDNFQEYAAQVTELANSVNNVFNALDDAQIQKAEEKNKKEKEDLKKRLDSGLISQKEYDKQVEKLDENLDKKKAEIAHRQAIRDKALSVAQIAINTATAIMRIWADVPKLDLGISTGALTAIASAIGAAQIAAVLATPIPKARQGGMIAGATHEQGGVLINMEDKERIISAKPAQAFPELLNLISYIGKHATIPDTGFAARSLLSKSATASTLDADELAQKIGANVAEAVQQTPIYLALTELNNAQDEYARIVQSAKM